MHKSSKRAMKREERKQKKTREEGASKQKNPKLTPLNLEEQKKDLRAKEAQVNPRELKGYMGNLVVLLVSGGSSSSFRASRTKAKAFWK